MADESRRQPNEAERCCSECGEIVSKAAAVCENCRAQLNPASSSQPIQSGTGLNPNVAAALCYLLTWITGIIFLLIKKIPSMFVSTPNRLSRSELRYSLFG